MTITEKRARFRVWILDPNHMSVLCGAFDGITARAAQAAGFFDGCYMGGQAAAFVRKIQAALRWRSDPNFLVIARSDAAPIYGQDEVIHRMNLAADAGADMGFLFSSQEVFPTLDDVKRACDKVRCPFPTVSWSSAPRCALPWTSSGRPGQER